MGQHSLDLKMGQNNSASKQIKTLWVKGDQIDLRMGQNNLGVNGSLYLGIGLGYGSNYLGGFNA